MFCEDISAKNLHNVLRQKRHLGLSLFFIPTSHQNKNKERERWIVFSWLANTDDTLIAICRLSIADYHLQASDKLNVDGKKNGS